MNGRVLLDGENIADVGFAVRKWGCDRGLIVDVCSRAMKRPSGIVIVVTRKESEA